jgi:hypothetical protein
VNCGHTRREEPPALSLADRVEGVIVDVGWACGLCSVSDCSPLAALRLWQRMPEGESSEKSPRPPFVRRRQPVFTGVRKCRCRSMGLGAKGPGPFSAGGPGLGMNVCA